MIGTLLALRPGMSRFLLVVALVAFAAPAFARTQKKPKPAPALAPAQPPAQAAAENGGSSGATAKQPKVKTYTFGGLDVEGKLKTPQLLYFLNRIKAEFDTSTLDKRSFMKELEQSADDKSL